jgi:hypothetical protein
MAVSKPGLADEAASDPSHACDRAATRAEADWHLPTGLLAAIGVVESGRTGLGSKLPVAWPWAVNAAGRGLYLSSKDAAVATVRAFQAAGLQVIDVGCFQVDLFYHPDAFATLDSAFDPEANAQAAASILARSRLSGSSWQTAVALYHSASSALGGRYLRLVQAAWPWASARSRLSLNASYVVLLSPTAEQVQVVIPADPTPRPMPGLPKVFERDASSGVLQWTATARTDLPAILVPRRSISGR